MGSILGAEVPDTVTKNSAQAAQPMRTSSPRLAEIAEKLRWEDLRTFLMIAQEHSFRSAARHANLSANTLRARMSRLEEDVGTSIFRRTRGGISLTSAGQDLATIAQNMLEASRSGNTPLSSDVLIHPGQIRIGSSESLGSFWLTPRLMNLQRALPHLSVNLLCDYDLARDRSAEVDISIGFTMPKDPDMIVARLGTLHFMLFASEEYAAQNGIPTTLDELRQHKFIEQASPGVHSYLLDFFVGTERAPDFVPIMTNSSICQFWAVASGAGIAALPTYAWALTKTVVPIEIPLNLRFDIFYSCHRTARNSPAVRAAIEWLKSSFDHDRHPWFATDFVHPSKFAHHELSGRVVSMYENAARQVGQEH
jgi:DNA-binding transcriptional LysR family regulator